MRPPSAGEVSPETVSVPLGGRRQVHLQQGELLGCRRRQRGNTFALEAESLLNILVPADHRRPFSHHRRDVHQKTPLLLKRSPRTSPLCFPHRLLLLFLLHQRLKLLLSKYTSSYFFLLLFEILCLAGHSNSESPVNVVLRRASSAELK